MSDDFAKGAAGPSQIYNIGPGPLDPLQAGLVPGQSAGAAPLTSNAWVAGDYKVSAVAADHADPNGGTWLLCDGSAISATFTALIALVGATRPDAQSRALVMRGTNSAALATDGVAEANRHGTRHRHTPHTHGVVFGGSGGAGATIADQVEDPANANHSQATTAVDGGSGVSTDPLDGGAYLVPGNLFIHT